MNAFDRDADLERRQIREISLNVARRLLDVLERPHMGPPAVLAEIEAGARVIADIQRQIDSLMSRWPEGELLDMAVLTHVLESHSRALSLVEDLETKAAGAQRPVANHPDPERTHAALIATAREIEREARQYEARDEPKYEPQYEPKHEPKREPAYDSYADRSPFPDRRPPFAEETVPFATRLPFAPDVRLAPHVTQSLWPQQGGPQPPRHMHAPRQIEAPRHIEATRQAQTPLPPARATRTGGGPPGPSQQPLSRTQTRGGPPQPPRKPQTPGEVPAASRAFKIRTLAFTPAGATTLVAGIAILAASLAGALSFALSTDDATPRLAATQTPGGKFDGRLSQADAIPTSGSDILVVSPPENTGNLAQPYLVVIATRRSTEELEQDFRHFKETHPKLLGDARGRVDSVQSQDGKTWYRLSLIPPRAQSEATELCEELKSAGLTECWIKPLPIGPSSG